MTADIAKELREALRQFDLNCCASRTTPFSFERLSRAIESAAQHIEQRAGDGDRKTLQKIYDELPLRDQDGTFEPPVAFARRLKQIAYEALLSHPPADRAEVVEGWRPIESAPKDGTEILVLGPAHPNDIYYAVAAFVDGRWYDNPEDVAEGWELHPPTHWLPLPQAPTSDSGEG